MPKIPPKRSPSPSEQPNADFNWPPTDDELTQYGIEIVQSEKSGPTRPPFTSSEQPRDDSNWPPTDDELIEYGIEIVQRENSEPVFDGTGLETGEAPLADVALAQSDTAGDGNNGGDWAAEMARVQALIEGLTQPLAWHFPES
jgi:hypothetical protein